MLDLGSDEYITEEVLVIPGPIEIGLLTDSAAVSQSATNCSNL